MGLIRPGISKNISTLDREPANQFLSALICHFEPRAYEVEISDLIKTHQIHAFGPDPPKHKIAQ